MASFCPLCGGKPKVGLSKLPGYFYCQKCQLGWRKKLAKVKYAEDYYQPQSNLASKLFRPIVSFFYALRQVYVGDGQNKLWMDVGAGDGEFLATIKALRRIGVEISSSGRRKMKEKGLETMTDQQFLKGQGLKAEVISFWHVLEHVGKPKDYLQAAKRYLVRDGQLLIGVPNLDSLSFRFFGSRWFHFQPKYHLWHFSPHSLTKILKKTGLHVKKIDYWSPEHSLAGILQTFINATAGSENVLHQLVKRGAGFFSLSTKDVFWIVFWLTLGLPIIFLFWLAGGFTHRSDTIVVVATVVK